MRGKCILEIKIKTQAPLHLKSENEAVEMIPFTGEARGEIFNGIVLPGGMDVQITNAVDVRHLSARYMLSGKDAEQTDTLIYVHNEAMIQNTGRKLPFYTIPHFITDNKKLAKYLCRNSFTGKIEKIDGQLNIRIFDLSE